MDKLIIRNNFSRNAAEYDDYAAVQKECAEKLITSVGEDKSFERILEIGCGTGIYTQMLREKFPDASITAVDISKEMITFAENKLRDAKTDFIVADGEKLDFTEKFDLITSNVSFQWFEDFGGTLASFSRFLAGGGELCFSMYAPDTFGEFKEVLRTHFGRRTWLSSSRFIPRDKTRALLEKHFGEIEMAEGLFPVNFVSLWDFLQDIKRSGSRGIGLRKGIYLGQHAIRAMEKTYIEKFKGITATHHVYFCKARV